MLVTAVCRINGFKLEWKSLVFRLKVWRLLQINLVGCVKVWNKSGSKLLDDVMHLCDDSRWPYCSVAVYGLKLVSILSRQLGLRQAAALAVSTGEYLSLQ